MSNQDVLPLIVIIIAVSALGLPLILTGLNLVNLLCKRQFKPNTVDGLIMILGPILTVILFMIWGPKNYDQALIEQIGLKWHTPLALGHLPTIIVLEILGLVGYIVLRKFRLKLPPLLIVMCISCMMLGSLIGVIWMIQISPHLFEVGSMIRFETLFFCVFPFNYIICCIAIIKNVIKEYTSNGEEKRYKNLILRKCDLLLQNSKNWTVLAIILMIPILVITLLILIYFGQQPNAVIKAFTETSDWLLSQKISPPPIEMNGHYLCTVSLRGHRCVVKPLRYGIRSNQKIVVNRQLCIANAFEQLIQELTPKIHRFIRYIYDKYGYPLSKHIVSPVSADIVYIFMKPLEWLFLIVLYLLDNKPEDRIATQYLPLDVIKINIQTMVN